MTFKNNIKLLNSYKTRSNKNNDMIDSIVSLYEELRGEKDTEYEDCGKCGGDVSFKAQSHDP